MRVIDADMLRASQRNRIMLYGTCVVFIRKEKKCR